MRMAIELLMYLGAAVYQFGDPTHSVSASGYVAPADGGTYYLMLDTSNDVFAITLSWKITPGVGAMDGGLLPFAKVTNLRMVPMQVTIDGTVGWGPPLAYYAPAEPVFAGTATL